MTKTNFKEKSMKKQSLVTKEASNRQHQTHGRPTTLTTHPATSHNIKLTKMEDGHDCLKNSCVYTQLLAKKLHVYADFGQKHACIGNFWPKIHVCTQLLAKNRVYREGSGKKQAKAKPIKGSVNG